MQGVGRERGGLLCTWGYCACSVVTFPVKWDTQAIPLVLQMRLNQLFFVTSPSQSPPPPTLHGTSNNKVGTQSLWNWKNVAFLTHYGLVVLIWMDARCASGLLLISKSAATFSSRLIQLRGGDQEWCQCEEEEKRYWDNRSHLTFWCPAGRNTANKHYSSLSQSKE